MTILEIKTERNNKREVGVRYKQLKINLKVCQRFFYKCLKTIEESCHKRCIDEKTGS